MTTQTPQPTGYHLPDSPALSQAADEALAAHEQASVRLGRVMTVVTAAAVRDILTGCDHEAPFDASHLELTQGHDSNLWATGRYWTADGAERHLAELGEGDGGNGVFDLNEWTPFLCLDNLQVWRPLCTELPDQDGRPAYRLDLTQAAALPLD